MRVGTNSLFHLSPHSHGGPKQPLSCTMTTVTQLSPQRSLGTLSGDEQSNAKCHFIIIKTQGVITIIALTHTFRTGVQRQTIQGEMCISPPSPPLHQPNTYFLVALRENLWGGKEDGCLKHEIWHISQPEKHASKSILQGRDPEPMTCPLSEGRGGIGRSKISFLCSPGQCQI